MFLPKGASSLVDEFGSKFVKKYGFDELSKVAKMNFKNVEKIKSLLQTLYFYIFSSLIASNIFSFLILLDE